jgi:hypothetical protein
MPTNNFFQDYSIGSQESSLVEDLIIESIQIHGVNVYYIPRESATGNIDKLYGEDTLSKFTQAYHMEAYVESTEGFDGQGEFLSKFGLDMNNQAELIVSIRRFGEATSQQFVRPREGDLVYLGFKPNLFEIKYVTDKTEFFQLGKLYFYKLRLEAFRYGNESIDTGITDVDDIGREVGFRIAFVLGSGSGNYQIAEQVYQGTSFATATAVADVASWDHPTKDLQVINIVGEFVANTNIVGVVSGASYQLTSYDDMQDENGGLIVNQEVNDEANTIIDFSEENPFSENLP